MSPTFADLGVPAALCQRLDELGIAEPFPVQAATLPDALAGRDVCGKAPTGSGKTIAFGLPLLARVGRARGRRPRALVLVPTRELASQVQDQLQQLTAGSGTTVLAVYGGAGMQHQMKVLASGAEVVVATPGRLKDLIDRGSLKLDEVDIVVVDEADRMADMGFLPEVRRLLDQVRPDRQTLLFSATLDGDVDVLIKKYQRDPAHHEAESLEEPGDVTHRFWSVSHGERVAVATTFAERIWPSIVFTRTRHGADRLAKQLKKAGVPAEAIHGDRSQSQRERALGAFGRGDVHVLVATDVAARGIHVDGVAGVLQYDAPATDKDYIHRSGRTGRAGADGIVVTMTTPEKEKALRALQRDLRRREPIEEVTAAGAAEALGVAPPKLVDRGDGLDGVPRRERPRADRPRGRGDERPDAGRRASTGARERRSEQDHQRDGRPAAARRDERGRSGAGQAPAPGARGGERRRARSPETGSTRGGQGAPTGARKGHRKGRNPELIDENDWVPRAKPSARSGKPHRQGSGPTRSGGAKATSGRPGGTKAGTGRPGAKPGRRPAGPAGTGKGRTGGGRAGRRSR